MFSSTERNVNAAADRRRCPVKTVEELLYGERLEVGRDHFLRTVHFRNFHVPGCGVEPVSRTERLCRR